VIVKVFRIRSDYTRYYQPKSYLSGSESKSIYKIISVNYLVKPEYYVYRKSIARHDIQWNEIDHA
jgi:hypothetical protein